MSTSQLDLSGNALCGINRSGEGTYTVEGITAIANALKVTASLTVTDLRYNNLDTESATMLAIIAKEKRISLCGIGPDQTEANLRGEAFRRMGPTDAILLTADLAARASLTECNLRNNNLGVEGWTIIFNALRDSPSSKITTWDLSYEELNPKIVKPLAEYISVSTSLTSVR